MAWDRREFLATGLGAAAGAALAGGVTRSIACPAPAAAVAGRRRREPGEGDWAAVREDFALDPDWIHMAGLLLSSHPAPVAASIVEHRLGLDDNPAHYLEDNRGLTEATRAEAAEYLGGRPSEVALTDSTTMGLGLVYNGISMRPDQELLTTEHDFHATHTALEYKAARSGAGMRRIPLYADIQRVSEAEIVERVARAVTARTRVVAVTWVHSSTGLKIPLRAVADRLEELNRGRSADDRALLCVDAVHAVGVEAENVRDLGCDVVMAGTHKWLFGPRGTGVVWGHPRAHDAVSPTIPTFTPGAGWGGRMTPGGYKPFEHQWALAEAFRFHGRLGKARVAERIHALNRQLKEGLARMDHVTLYTPVDETLSSGITCFDVAGLSPGAVVRRLHDAAVIASTTPYSPSHARLAPGLLNDETEVERTLAAVHALG